MRHKLAALTGLLGLLIGLAFVTTPGNTADHLDAPLVAEAGGQKDINDLYAFQSPTNPDNTVFIMTVNPLAGVLSPATFGTDVLYAFRIDLNGDYKQDATWKFRFGPEQDDGTQRTRVQMADGTRIPGNTGDVINLPGGGMYWAGMADDPFFFDLVAFQDQVAGAGGDRTFCDGNEHDFLAGTNVSAIVVEIPNYQLIPQDEAATEAHTDTNIGVWAETATKADGRVDRMGRPAINTVLIDSAKKDIFNKVRPHNDVRRFNKMVRRNLRILSGLDGSGYTKVEAQGIADLLTPDVLTIDVANPAGFTDGPLNGRNLAEDVIDFELFVVTGGLAASGSPVLDSDCVPANDVPFSDTFPYLAPPHVDEA